MALYYDLPVFKDMYSLALQVFELTQHFSREYKFTLGQDMKRDCIMLVRSIYRANKCKEKEAYLEQFLDDFEVLKLEIRLCKDLRLITIKQQAHLEVFFELIGKSKVEHCLNVHVFTSFLKGMIPFGGYFTPHYCPAFLYGCQDLGIERWIFCADGAFPIYPNFSGGLGLFFFIHKVLLLLRFEYTLFKEYCL
ncbi:hypothetical protein FACS1894137_00270 [Spirochaetia bacterium]|nr:hypothetical protein FACS1894137_00270 [Spirochaetia bacterium]